MMPKLAALLRICTLACCVLTPLLGSVAQAIPSPAVRAPATPTAPAVLYFFTTASAPGSPEAAARGVAFVKKHAGRVELRPVLLLADFSVIRRVTEEGVLTRTLRALGEPGSLRIPLYDVEGLALAEAWGLREVPAFVLVAHGRAHRAVGARADLEALLECAP